MMVDIILDKTSYDGFIKVIKRKSQTFKVILKKWGQWGE